MIRVCTGAALRRALAVAVAVAATGCSDSGSVAAIDQKSAIEKVTGSEGKAPQSAKARAASEEAARKHPKLR
jgi:hypothetical protein